ncbi:spore germination protein [Tissierella creatinophila]|uniref:Spore germination protein B1 n=1 Tax=Tissierella creatinophila DSM 6911 TaxID=1123403 RepID=A0A1U7M8L3_TISCR|nr:spore germination protein [Tissierella creatinophila]OLS03652.1 spore germination protein B1 [Tissierella creatinophila DSM 6911]
MISEDIIINKINIKELFNNTSDLVLYEFKTVSEISILIGYIDGMIDTDILNSDLIKPLKESKKIGQSIISEVYISKYKEIKDLKQAIRPISTGGVIVFIDGIDSSYTFNIGQWSKRSIDIAQNETSIRGPQEAFIEDIGVNKTLIRRKVKSNNLVFEDYTLGNVTNTDISLVYIKTIVKMEVLEELKSRLQRIKTDKIIDSGNIEQYIDDDISRIFASLSYTERPDILVGKMSEGHIGVLCDGSPNVLTLPKLFIENFHTSEDQYIRPQYATFLRIIRLIAFVISFTFPSVYLSLILFHQEMIPTDLLISIATQREGVPLSSPFEVIMMILFFELLKESAIRLPKSIGQAVTLVGGLVIGQAAIDARIVTATLVIAVAVSGMAEFVVPKLREMITIYRILLVLIASVSGLYGVSLGLVMIGVQLTSMKSFGIPYMWPIAPFDRQGMKDNILKFPMPSLNKRPNVLTPKKSRKRDEDIE